MTKEQFTKKLQDKLRILDDNEVREILSEYSYHVDQRILEGKTEEEAIADFGNIDVLAKEILSAYHIEEKPKTLEDYFSEVVKFVNKTTEKVMKFDSKLLANFLVELVMTIIILVVFRWALVLVVGVLGRFLTFASWGLFHPLRIFIDFVLSLAYFLFSVYVLYEFVKRKLFDEKSEAITSEMVSSEPVVEEKAKPKKVKTASHYQAPNKDKTVKIKPMVVEGVAGNNEELVLSETKENQDLKPVTSKSNENNVSEVLLTLVRFVLGIFVWLPALVIMLGCIVAFGFAVTIVVTNMKFIWFLLITTGCLFVAVAFVVPLGKLILGKALR